MSRDRTVEDTFYLAFTTRAFATGIPTILAGSPVISAYEDVGLTQITAGLTLGVDHDGITGLNMITIAATGANGFESGKDYQLVITTGTVGGVSVVGEVIGQFSLGLSAAAVDLANATDGLTVLKASLDDIPTVAEFNARSLLAASYFDPAADAVANVTLVATTTTNTDMRGTDSANTVVPPSVAQFDARTLLAASYFDPAVDAVANVTLVDTTTTNTDMVGTDGANTVVPPSVAQFNARTLATADYFDPAADTVANVTTVATLTGHTAQTGDNFALIGTAGAGLTDITINAASVDLIWDEILTGATHNINTSAGKRLRQVAATIFSEGTAQSATASTLQLESGAITLDDQFKRSKVIIIAGTGLGQEALITGSTASTDTLNVTPEWLVTPDATTEYEVLPGQVHTTIRNGGYDGGVIYVDVVNGAAGTVVGVNGTTTHKSSVLADARALADEGGLRKFILSGGGAFSLDQSYTDWIFEHANASQITLNSQDISGTVFMRTGITGVGTATTRGVFELCGLATTTVGVCNFLQCGFGGTITLSAEDRYLAWDCFELAETMPIIDMAGDGATATVLELVNYSGRVEIQNMTSTDLLVLTGQAHVTFNANCSGGAATIAGDVKITDSSGNVTITEANISDILVDTGTTIPATLGSPAGASVSADIADIPTVAEFDARTLVAASYFDPAADAVANVTLVATTTDVTNQVTADVTAISGDSTAADNLEASLETLVLGTATGTPTTTTMPDSALTEATNDHYNGRIIIWRTGVLAGQATDITGYNGTTKTFTFTATTDAAGASDAYVIV